jgi:short-subunit dehydrogenase
MTQTAIFHSRTGSRNSMVMITGATGGLGKAFAVECASRGWDLCLTDLNDEKLNLLAESLCRVYHVRVLTRTCDLTDSSSRTELFAYLNQSRTSFWGLINVAGLDYEGAFLDCSRQQIRTILRLNLEGTLETTHAILERRDPLAPFRIINVASLAAYYPMPIKATYAASKRFLLDFSLALREELGPMGVTVTALCPAGLPTTPECIRAIEAQGLLGQLTTQDVGAVAAITIDAALRGKTVVIPGWINQAINIIGGIIPPQWIAYLVNRRWQAAHRQRQFGRIDLPAEASV